MKEKSIQLLPLRLMKAGDKGIIRAINGHGIHVQLEKLGLRIGDEFLVIQSQGFGPLSVKKGDTRLGLGSGMALKIMVEIL